MAHPDLQDVRGFTVRIGHRAEPARTVGTGFVVAAGPGPRIATCAHVVRAAGLDPRTGLPLEPPAPGVFARILRALGRPRRATADAGASSLPVTLPKYGGRPAAT